MGQIINIITQETKGERFFSHKYCVENVKSSIVEYETQDVTWKDYGETEVHPTPIYLKDRADRLQGKPSIMTYFLDGSRHTYKVDDISYKNNVYPIVAGQVGVGCCERINKQLRPALPFDKNIVLALPDKAFSHHGLQADQKPYIKKLLKTINSSYKVKLLNDLTFSDLLIYSTDTDMEFEKRGISKIQDYMIEKEKKLVAQLVEKDKLDNKNYLIKDGSIDYQRVLIKNNPQPINLSDKHIKNYYRYVIGVSKSFNPTNCFIKGGGTNSDIIAKLKPYERTPAYRYHSSRANADFCIWYLRIRDTKYSYNVFDGILKIEKLIVTNEEDENGISSDTIDTISAHLLNERSPVCYGADPRWANHLYPIYLTESYIKSKYISNNLFLQLF